jgi:hypothetical protein
MSYYNFLQRCVSTGVERTSRLFLADLGGSEQVKKSMVEVNRHEKEKKIKKYFYFLCVVVV